MFSSPFGVPEEHLIPSDCEIVVVADLFAEDYLGGAELTTKALIDSSPFKVHKVHSKHVTLKTLESGYNKFWIFTNFSAMDMQLIPTIVANLKYSVVEYDYKFCRYRSIEKHKNIEMKDCDCADEMHGKLVSTFFHAAKTVHYMSYAQMNRYLDRFPFLADPNEGSNQNVLSSAFSDEFFITIKMLREKYKDVEKTGWVVCGSTSWIKGTQDAVNWCNENNHDFTVLQGMSHAETLEIMAQAKGFVYLPKGGDTCPRMVIEAQLLGCELHLNEHVQHQTEVPFCDDNLEDVEIYLYGNRKVFWDMTAKDMDHKATVSGYTTTYNCISQGYPYGESIESLLGFCDEVVVMDAGSDDGTWETLQAMASGDDRIKVYQHIVDYKSKRFAVEDGAQKARARAKCTMDFCWQMDSDEIVSANAKEKILKICQQFPKFVDIIALPVVEYWGSTAKIRMDINPWKWRLSRNKPTITHGVPKELRLKDSEGRLYSKPGTDGCDYINVQTFERLPHASFYTQEAHNVRINAIMGNESAFNEYGRWFVNVISAMPFVHHYSWLNIERKIKTYKNYWQQHWESLYDIQQEDTAENNMFFDKPWSEVSDDEITQMAKDLAEKTGGHVFHSKIDWNNVTPHLQINFNENSN